MANTFNLSAGGYNMPKSNMQLGELRANFADIERVTERMTYALKKLALQHQELTSAARSGVVSMQDYDDLLSTYIRVEIHRHLTAIREKAMKSARSGMKASIGGTAGAIMRRTYKDIYGGNINLVGSRRRLSSKRRPYIPGHQRDVAARTKQINEYYGPDRAFVLRILEIGRDAFMAESTTGAKGKGSRASWGRRGAMSARGFFNAMRPDMELAAQQLGQDITKFVEQLIEKQ